MDDLDPNGQQAQIELYEQVKNTCSEANWIVENNLRITHSIALQKAVNTLDMDKVQSLYQAIESRALQHLTFSEETEEVSAQFQHYLYTLYQHLLVQAHKQKRKKQKMPFLAQFSLKILSLICLWISIMKYIDLTMTSFINSQQKANTLICHPLDNFLYQTIYANHPEDIAQTMLKYSIPPISSYTLRNTLLFYLYQLIVLPFQKILNASTHLQLIYVIAIWLVFFSLAFIYYQIICFGAKKQPGLQPLPKIRKVGFVKKCMYMFHSFAR